MSDAPQPVDPVRIAGRRRTGSWIRLVVVLVFAFAVCFPALLLVALLFAGARLGWLWSLLAFGLLGVATGWLAIAKDWDVARRRAAAGLGVVLGVVGVAVAHMAPPTPGRLRHAIRELEQPAWHLVDDSVDGNAMCFDYCWSVTREYRVDADLDDLRQELRPLLVSHGLQPTPAFDPERFEFADDDGGDIDLRMDIARGSGGGSVVYITARA